MFRTATLFFALLVAFVKHADGMRSPSRPEAMLEREEITSWAKDSCAKFGAKKKSWWSNTCQCPEELPLPRKCEGTSGSTFILKETIEAGSNCRCEDPCAKFGAKQKVDHLGKLFCKCPTDRPRPTKECGGGGTFVFPLSSASSGCRCVLHAELLEAEFKLPVAASALRFCDALVEHSHGAMNGTAGDASEMQSRIKDALKKTSPEICQHALVGTITPTEAKKAPFAEKASELSQKGSADGDQDRAYGRMQPVKKDATTSGEKELWEHALAQVCKDECEDLLDMMKEETDGLAQDVVADHTPFAQSCAERVVKQVEAEVLGCCARSCGFNSRTCLLWPFFSPKEKVEWEVECCAEMSILKNSSRELMCNSVLSGRLAIAASQYDLNEQAGTDIGKVLIGQNSSLVWTKEGARRFGFNTGDKVSMDFLVKHQKVGEEYLRLGYFREKQISKMLDESTSLMEVSSQDSTCDFGKFKKQCPKHFVNNYIKTCQDSWNVAEEHEEHGDFEERLKDLGFGDCSLNKPQYVAAPEDCDRLANESSDEILVVYFTHEHDNKEKPIACVTVGKKQCHGMAQWWKEIQLKSVQDMMNGPEIKDYTDRVYYVKVKADSKQTNQ